MFGQRLKIFGCPNRKVNTTPRLISKMLIKMYSCDLECFVLQLAEKFKFEINPVMQSLGYCCGNNYRFAPQKLCCSLEEDCSIAINAHYLTDQTRQFFQTSSLHSDCVLFRIFQAQHLRKMFHRCTWRYSYPCRGLIISNVRFCWEWIAPN